MFNEQFQFYSAPAQSVRSSQTMSIADAYLYITRNRCAMEHTARLRALLEAACRGETSEGEARRYKASAFDFVCFSGTFSYRKDDCLLRHSSLLCLDFDHVGDADALASLRQRLLADPYFTTQLLFTSPGGHGLKWVVDIDLALGSHQEWFGALRNYLPSTYGVEPDEKCANVSRACFLPHDADCYVNPLALPEKADVPKE